MVYKRNGVNELRTEFSTNIDCIEYPVSLRSESELKSKGNQSNVAVVYSERLEESRGKKMVLC